MALVEPRRAPAPVPPGSHGCFETLCAYGGRLFRLDAHLDRLYASARFLGTRAPADRRALGRRLTDALARSGLREAVVRVALIPAPRGGEARPHLVVRPIQRPPAADYRRGIRIAIVPDRPFGVGGISPQAKYSARLGSVLALADAHLRGVAETLWLAPSGSVTESTASNVGLVKGRVIATPPCWLGLLAGITREVIGELAVPLRLRVVEVPLTRHDLYNADEVFLTSTIKEFLPVTWVDGRVIGTGRPGRVTQQLQRAFRALVRKELRLGSS